VRHRIATAKKGVALLLQGMVVLLAACALAFLLWEPHVEGRNAKATLFEIYFHDPFLAYVYLGSTPFFLALFRTFRLLGHFRTTETFPSGGLQALRTIQRCGFAMIGFVAIGVGIILMFGDREDRPAGLFMAFLVGSLSGVIAAAPGFLARALQRRFRQA